MDLRMELNRYLQNIRANLRLDPSSEKEILREIATHVEDRCTEMQKSGLSEEEALEKCLRLLGPAKSVGRQIYETHSQGTWRQALLASLPHLFFAGLFALNWLSGLAWVPVMLLVIAAIVIYGLLHGKPGWLFPWLGYSLYPVAAAGVSLFYLPPGWSWIALLLYIPLVVWLSCFITIKFLRRDWLYSTLMLLPVPAFVGWFLASAQAGPFSLEPPFLSNITPWTGVTFLLLALFVTVFVRLKNRALRITALIIAGLTSSVIITMASNRLGFIAFLGLTALMFTFLLVPAYVEHRVRDRQEATLP
jgi:hypothetical protein